MLQCDAYKGYRASTDLVEATEGANANGSLYPRGEVGRLFGSRGPDRHDVVRRVPVVVCDSGAHEPFVVQRFREVSWHHGRQEQRGRGLRQSESECRVRWSAAGSGYLRPEGGG